MNQVEFAAHLRALPCESCPIHLRCMMGRADQDAIFCQKCQGWYILNQSMTIRCGDFTDLQVNAEVPHTWQGECPVCCKRVGAEFHKGTPIKVSRVTF